MSANKRNVPMVAGDSCNGYPISGAARNVITASAATLALSGKDSNSLVEITRAAGCAITLPESTACQQGTCFEIVVGVTLTGDSTITRAGSDLLAGVILTAADGAAAGSDVNGTVITFDQSASAVVGNRVVITKGSGVTWYFQAASPIAVGITVA